MSLWIIWWLWNPSEVWRALCAWNEHHKREGGWIFILNLHKRKIARFMLFSGSGSCSWPSSPVSPLCSGFLFFLHFWKRCHLGSYRCVYHLWGSGERTTWKPSSTSLTSSSQTGWNYFQRNAMQQTFSGKPRWGEEENWRDARKASCQSWTLRR